MKRTTMQRIRDGIWRRILFAWVLVSLKVRRLFSRGDLFVDYGWAKILFSDDGDDQELTYHHHQREYEQTERAILSRYVAEGDTVVDVGANIGFISTILAQLVTPTGAVHAFEPSGQTYEKLVKMI